jgi:hypothetical protein
MYCINIIQLKKSVEVRGKIRQTKDFTTPARRKILAVDKLPPFMMEPDLYLSSPAHFVLSQNRGATLLQDVNNFHYRILGQV